MARHLQQMLLCHYRAGRCGGLVPGFCPSFSRAGPIRRAASSSSSSSGGGGGGGGCKVSGPSAASTVHSNRPPGDDPGTRGSGSNTGGGGNRGSEKPGLLESLQGLDATTRYQLAVLAGGTCVMSVGFGTISPILPTFASQWGDMGATGIGLVIAAPALAKLLLNHASGRRADTHGRVPSPSAYLSWMPLAYPWGIEVEYVSPAPQWH